MVSQIVALHSFAYEISETAKLNMVSGKEAGEVAWERSNSCSEMNYNS